MLFSPRTIAKPIGPILYVVGYGNKLGVYSRLITRADYLSLIGIHPLSKRNYANYYVLANLVLRTGKFLAHLPLLARPRWVARTQKRIRRLAFSVSMHLPIRIFGLETFLEQNSLCPFAGPAQATKYSGRTLFYHWSEFIQDQWR